MIKESKNISEGDLVRHILYGKTWLALVLKVDRERDALSSDQNVLVHMIPGTDYDDYFVKPPVLKKVASPLSGWVMKKWLRKIKLTS